MFFDARADELDVNIFAWTWYSGVVVTSVFSVFVLPVIFSHLCCSDVLLNVFLNDLQQLPFEKIK